MAKPISIGIAADTRDAATAINKGIIDPLEDVVDALDDVERDSDKATDGLVADMKRAQQETEELGDEHKKLSDIIREQAQRSRKAQQDNSSEATRSAKDDLRELGDEAKSNASEVFSSFDGSMTSFADGLQGTLGGIVASLGPGGAIAGALGALAIGLTIGNLELSEEARQEFLESVSELTAEYLEFGQVGQRSADAVLQQLQAIAQETDRGKTNLQDWEKLSGQISVEVEGIANAYLMGGKPLDDIIAKTNEALRAERQWADEATGFNGMRDAASSDRITNLEEESRLLTQQKERIEAAQEAQLLYLQAGGTEHELKVAQIEALNEAYDETAAAIDEFSVSEGGALDPQKYIDGMTARAEALANYKNDLATADLSVEAKTFLETQGVDAASRFMAGYKSATPEQQAQLNAIWSEAGRQNSGEYAGALRDGMPATITGPTVEPQLPDLSEVRNKFQFFFNQNPVKVPFAQGPITPGRDVG